jgi:DNA-binding response OmpR family regulator
MQTRILVVEDNPTARVALTARLQAAGYSVVIAADGETALQLLTAEHFDLVLTDIVMGDVSGIDVLRCARQLASIPEVILLTGHGALDTCMAAVREGAFEYLLKPCPTERLLDCVQRALVHHAAEQQIRQAASSLVSALAVRHAGQGIDQAGGPHPGDTAGAVPAPAQQQVGELLLGRTRQLVQFRGHPVVLTTTEYAVLRRLAETPGQVISYSDIVRASHGLDLSTAQAKILLKAHINNLRKKLAPAYIVNERGRGYRLVDPRS